MLTRHEEMCENMLRSGKFEDPVNYHRASGACKCKVCGYDYREHPQHIPHYYLNVLCDGTLVKL